MTRSPACPGFFFDDYDYVYGANRKASVSSLSQELDEEGMAEILGSFVVNGVRTA